MILRFTLPALVAALALSGCAKYNSGTSDVDFADGPTRVNITHLYSRTDDGAPFFITVDGNDAGSLPQGDSIELHLPAGKHQIGGYARSLVGRVTIAPVEITTTPDVVKYVTYSVTRSKPEFREQKATSKQLKAEQKRQEAQEQEVLIQKTLTQKTQMQEAQMQEALTQKKLIQEALMQATQMPQSQIEQSE